MNRIGRYAFTTSIIKVLRVPLKIKELIAKSILTFNQTNYDLSFAFMKYYMYAPRPLPLPRDMEGKIEVNALPSPSLL